MYNSQMFDYNYKDVGHSGMEDYHQIYFANGGDRTSENVPEVLLYSYTTSTS